jgi:hypothetical protein
VIGRGKTNGVNVPILQQFANVAITFHLLAAVGEFLHAFVQNDLVHVAQGDDPNAFDLSEALMWLRPRPLKPATATRRSSLAPRTRLVGLGAVQPTRGRALREAETMSEFRINVRRFILFMALLDVVGEMAI